MQELRQESEIRTKAKSKVGTVNANSLNYSRHIPAFDSSHIPIRASSIKSEIKQSTAKDILNTKNSQWNPSVLLDRTKEYHQQISLNQLHFEIRKGIRDISNPPPSTSKIYDGVDTRDDYSGWNISVQFNPLEHKKNHVLVNKEARHKSATKNKEILKEKEYIKPYARQVNILDQIRKDKLEDKGLKDKFIKEVVHENPDISSEKALATVFKLVAQKKLKDGQEALYGVKEESFRPNMDATIKKNVVKKFKHDGCFQFSEAVGKEIWSCCAKDLKEAQGCVVVSKNLDKWQTISF